MLWINLSILPILIIWAGIISFLCICAILKTKSFFCLIDIVISLVLLAVHMTQREAFTNWQFNVICDLIFLGVSMSFNLYINDIEARRKVISEVFENRYKNRSKK